MNMNEFAQVAMSFEKKDLPLKHIPGPIGVRGRNSDNTLIRARLGWEPSIPLRVGLEKTYFWIKEQIMAERANGIFNGYNTSQVVVQVTDTLDSLNKAGH